MSGITGVDRCRAHSVEKFIKLCTKLLTRNHVECNFECSFVPIHVVNSINTFDLLLQHEHNLMNFSIDVPESVWTSDSKFLLLKKLRRNPTQNKTGTQDTCVTSKIRACNQIVSSNENVYQIQIPVLPTCAYIPNVAIRIRVIQSLCIWFEMYSIIQVALLLCNSSNSKLNHVQFPVIPTYSL